MRGQAMAQNSGSAAKKPDTFLNWLVTACILVPMTFVPILFLARITGWIVVVPTIQDFWKGFIKFSLGQFLPGSGAWSWIYDSTRYGGELSGRVMPTTLLLSALLLVIFIFNSYLSGPVRRSKIMTGESEARIIAAISLNLIWVVYACYLGTHLLVENRQAWLAGFCFLLPVATLVFMFIYPRRLRRQLMHGKLGKILKVQDWQRCPEANNHRYIQIVSATLQAMKIPASRAGQLELWMGPLPTGNPFTIAIPPGKTAIYFPYMYLERVENDLLENGKSAAWVDFPVRHEIAHFLNRDALLYLWASTTSEVFLGWILMEVVLNVLLNVPLLSGEMILVGLVNALLFVMLFASIRREREAIADARVMLSYANPENFPGLSFFGTSGYWVEGDSLPLSQWLAKILAAANPWFRRQLGDESGEQRQAHIQQHILANRPQFLSNEGKIWIAMIVGMAFWALFAVLKDSGGLDQFDMLDLSTFNGGVLWLSLISGSLVGLYLLFSFLLPIRHNVVNFDLDVPLTPGSVFRGLNKTACYRKVYAKSIFSSVSLVTRPVTLRNALTGKFYFQEILYTFAPGAAVFTIWMLLSTFLFGTITDYFPALLGMGLSMFTAVIVVLIFSSSLLRYTRGWEAIARYRNTRDNLLHDIANPILPVILYLLATTLQLRQLQYVNEPYLFFLFLFCILLHLIFIWAFNLFCNIDVDYQGCTITLQLIRKEKRTFQINPKAILRRGLAARFLYSMLVLAGIVFPFQNAIFGYAYHHSVMLTDVQIDYVPMIGANTQESLFLTVSAILSKTPQYFTPGQLSDLEILEKLGNHYLQQLTKPEEYFGYTDQTGARNTFAVITIEHAREYAEAANTELYLEALNAFPADIELALTKRIPVQVDDDIVVEEYVQIEIQQLTPDPSVITTWIVLVDTDGSRMWPVWDQILPQSKVLLQQAQTGNLVDISVLSIPSATTRSGQILPGNLHPVIAWKAD